jgi:hypothetical protein
MKTAFRVFALVIAGAIAAGCASAPKRADYTAIQEEKPRSILVVPPINKSVEVNAPDYFLTTIATPLAERGYYVFPVNTVRTTLADDGLSDANLVRNGDPRRLGELFGADSVLYISIERWDARYLVLQTTVTVELTYVLKSARTGRELWRSGWVVKYTPGGSNAPGLAGLLATAVKAAIAKAAPNYMPLAKQANIEAITLAPTALPLGPYATLAMKN